MSHLINERNKQHESTDETPISAFSQMQDNEIMWEKTHQLIYSVLTTHQKQQTPNVSRPTASIIGSPTTCFNVHILMRPKILIDDCGKSNDPNFNSSSDAKIYMNFVPQNFLFPASVGLNLTSTIAVSEKGLECVS